MSEPHGDDSALPPAAPEATVTEGSAPDASSPLARPRRTLWQRVGGEGLALSVLIHILLILIAVVWVVSTITDNSGKKDPNTFATGAGGGSGGPTAKQFKTKTVPKNIKSLAKANTRITSKNANSTLAVASLPSMSNPLLSAGAVGGGSSKGFGGGSGGGIGSGRGAGVGGGKNFVSLFGAKGGASYGIQGNFYDFKQTSSGGRGPLYGNPDIADLRDPQYRAQNGRQNSLYAGEIREFIVTKDWSVTSLSDKYRAPEPLYASQIFIPPGPAAACPKAYGVYPKVKPSRWMAHYKGKVKCPQTGKFRFVGSGDDILVVRWNRKIALDSGYYQPVVGNSYKYQDFGGAVCDDTHPSSLGTRPLRAGPWIQIKAGDEVEIEIAFGEMPGGGFYGILCIEPQGQGLKLLRFTKDELPKEIQSADVIKAKIDMQAEGWIFTALKPTGGTVQR
jgi:hypothetical protein